MCDLSAPDSGRYPDSASGTTRARRSSGNCGRSVSRRRSAHGQWPLAGKNFAHTRFSDLDQINTGNVKNLRPVWTFATGVHRGHEGAPVIANDTMYLISPYPNIVFALDPLTGRKKWTLLPNPDAAAQGVACCDAVNRGVAYSAGKRPRATARRQTEQAKQPPQR